MALTDTAIRNAKKAAKPYKLADAGGLHLYISTTGGKLWRLKYRHAGKGGASLFRRVSHCQPWRRARRSARRPGRQLAEGKNPLGREEAGGDRRKGRPEQHVCHGRRGADRQTRARGHGRHDRRQAEVVYLPLLGKIGERPIGQIEAFELLGPLQKIEASGRHETATNTLALAGRVLPLCRGHWAGQARRGGGPPGALTAPEGQPPRGDPRRQGRGPDHAGYRAYEGRRATPPRSRPARPHFPPTGRASPRPLARIRPRRSDLAHPRRADEDAQGARHSAFAAGRGHAARASRHDGRRRPCGPLAARPIGR